jgi:hypothetical protein
MVRRIEMIRLVSTILILLLATVPVYADEYDFERRQRNARGVWECTYTYILYNENGKHLSGKTLENVGDQIFLKISENAISFKSKLEWTNPSKIEWNSGYLTASSNQMLFNFNMETKVFAKSTVLNFTASPIIVSSLGICKKLDKKHEGLSKRDNSDTNYLFICSKAEYYDKATKKGPMKVNASASVSISEDQQKAELLLGSKTNSLIGTRTNHYMNLTKEGTDGEHIFSGVENAGNSKADTFFSYYTEKRELLASYADVVVRFKECNDMGN